MSSHERMTGNDPEETSSRVHRRGMLLPTLEPHGTNNARAARAFAMKTDTRARAHTHTKHRVIKFEH